MAGLEVKRRKTKELTNSEIMHRNEIALKRKHDLKRQIEEQKYLTIEKISNEAGKKLKDMMKKNDDFTERKALLRSENKRKAVNRIQLKMTKERTTVRFPQGMLLPSIINQKRVEYPKVGTCEVQQCKKGRKYRDTVTKIGFCSLECFRKLRNLSHN